MRARKATTQRAAAARTAEGQGAGGVGGAAAGRYRYRLVGNGWCLNPEGQRIHLGPMHALEINWKVAEVDGAGRARDCEEKCSADADCLGYMTEDRSKCDIIRRGDHNWKGGIQAADSETRNICWTRLEDTREEEESGKRCGAMAKWSDGREEPRRCAYLKYEFEPKFPQGT